MEEVKKINRTQRRMCMLYSNMPNNVWINKDEAIKLVNGGNWNGIQGDILTLEILGLIEVARSQKDNPRYMLFRKKEREGSSERVD